MELKASRIHEKGSRLLRIAYLRMTPNIRSKRSKTDSNMKKIPKFNFKVPLAGKSIWIVWFGGIFPKNFPCWFKNPSNIEATTPSVFSGRKKTRHRFFWPRLWFPPLVQACKGVPHKPRVGRKSTPQGVRGEKRWLSVGWVGTENDSSPSKRCQRKKTSTAWSPTRAMPPDRLHRWKIQRESLQEVFVFYRWTVSQKLFVSMPQLLYYISLHMISLGGWLCPLYMAYL